MNETMDTIAVIVLSLVALSLMIGLVIGGLITYRERRKK